MPLNNSITTALLSNSQLSQAMRGMVLGSMAHLITITTAQQKESCASDEWTVINNPIISHLTENLLDYISVIGVKDIAYWYSGIKDSNYWYIEFMHQYCSLNLCYLSLAITNNMADNSFLKNSIVWGAWLIPLILYVAASPETLGFILGLLLTYALIENLFVFTKNIRISFNQMLNQAIELTHWAKLETVYTVYSRTYQALSYNTEQSHAEAQPLIDVIPKLVPQSAPITPSQPSLAPPPLVNLNSIVIRGVVCDNKALLGQGSFGAVYKGRWQNIDVAVKSLTMHLTEKQRKALKREIRVHQELRHPNIVLLYGITHPHNQLIIEYCALGSLRMVLDNERQSLPLKLKLEIALGIAKGLAYLHSMNIVHGDIKSPNILLNQDLTPKIADFGFAKQLSTDSIGSESAGKGSIRWMAPELFQLGARPTRESDMYSFATVLWEILTGKLPFATTEVRYISGLVTQGEHEVIPDNPPNNCRDVLESCWKLEPRERMSAQTAVDRLTPSQSSGSTLFGRGPNIRGYRKTSYADNLSSQRAYSKPTKQPPPYAGNLSSCSGS